MALQLHLHLTFGVRMANATVIQTDHIYHPLPRWMRFSFTALKPKGIAKIVGRKMASHQLEPVAPNKCWQQMLEEKKLKIMCPTAFGSKVRWLALVTLSFRMAFIQVRTAAN